MSFNQINKSDNLDLRLIGNGKFIELIDIFADEYFIFKEGDVNLRVILKGTLNKPLLNGFIVVKDSEINFLNNIVKDINSTIIFDFDSLEINNLQANVKDSGKIFINGSLPFYSENILFIISWDVYDCLHNFFKILINLSSSNLCPKELEVSITPSV